MNKHTFVTHKDVRKAMYQRYPGLDKEVAVELAGLRIAEKIAELRRNAHLSQKQLAGKLGMSQSSLARMESTDYRDYKVSTLVKIATVTGGGFVIRPA